MTRNTSEAADGAGNISVNIAEVAKAAAGTLSRAQASQKAAQDLTSVATQLSELLAQFKIERSDRRVSVSLPVTLTAIDIFGRPLEQEVRTVDVSRRGALLAGIQGKLRVDSEVSLGRFNKHEQFKIAWVGNENGPEAGRIGVSALNAATSFWRDVIPTQLPPELISAAASAAKKYAVKPKATLHRA
jgi:hypothetical protein